MTHVKRRLVGEVEISQEAMDRFRGGAAEFADLLKEHYQLGIVAQFDDQVPMQGLFEEPKGRRAEFRL